MKKKHKIKINNQRGNTSLFLCSQVLLPPKTEDKSLCFPAGNLFCKIKNCNKKYYAKGYCHNHYFTLIYYPLHKKHWCKHQKQYRLKKYGIGNKIHKCRVKNCDSNTYKKNRYCERHRERLARHLPLDLSISGYKLHAPRGKRNYMWRGGIATYPNHYLMKKNRLIILMQNPKCEKCDNPATQIHHKDNTKTNHSLSNLQALCHSCHRKTFSKIHKSKYNKIYGMNLNEIAKKLQKSYSIVYGWHKQNKLSQVIL